MNSLIGGILVGIGTAVTTIILFLVVDLIISSALMYILSRADMVTNCKEDRDMVAIIGSLITLAIMGIVFLIIGYLI